MVKKYSKRRLTHKKKGGALDCTAEGFNANTRTASMGFNYPDAIVSHANSEQWPFERLVDISTRGLVGWYCKKAKLSPEECATVTSMPEVQILGAFFHRYKVFIEHIHTARQALRKGWPAILMIPGKKDQLIVRLYQSKKDSDQKLFMDLFTMQEYFYGTKKYDDFFTAELPLESAVEKVQCLLWVIVKNKKLPPGFVMDKRIEIRAKTPIILMDGQTNFGDDLSSRRFNYSIPQIVKLISIVETDKIELMNPEVTFGVY